MNSLRLILLCLLLALAASCGMEGGDPASDGDVEAVEQESPGDADDLTEIADTWEESGCLEDPVEQDSEEAADEEESGCLEEPGETEHDPAEDIESLDEEEYPADEETDGEEAADQDVADDGSEPQEEPEVPDGDEEASDEDDPAMDDETDLPDDDTEPEEQVAEEPDDAPELDEETTPSPCPSDMVHVDRGQDSFCIDRYEASRPDATAQTVGVETNRAYSRVGVMPWYDSTLSLTTAKNACLAAGKYLCTGDQWFSACQGPDHTVYSYGDTYNPVACNGIDAHCNCEPAPGCYSQCGGTFGAEPTGSKPDCTNEYGVFDINGNVWELADHGDGGIHFRGGAYNCSNSQLLHRCDSDYVNILAKGFRCCQDPATAR